MSLLDDLFAGLMVIAAIASAFIAHSGAWAYVTYILVVLLTAAAVTQAVHGHKHGRNSAEYATAAAMVNLGGAAYFAVQVIQDIAVGRGTTWDIIMLLIWLANWPHNRAGRKRALKLIGEKSRAALDKLRVPQTAASTR